MNTSFGVISQLLDELACRERAKEQLQTQGGYSLTIPYYTYHNGY